MSKCKNKALDRLDRRVKDWSETCKRVGAEKSRGYRKPGSMKK